MAQTAVRVRFVFNQSSGTSAHASRQRLGKDFAATLVDNLTFRAAENEFRDIKQRIETSFAADAKRELAHMASLYRRHIVGAGRTKTRPSGMLGYALGASDTGVGDDDNEISIAEMLPDWAPRSPKYMREKARKGWTSQWFSARGNLARNMRADTLLAAFGPIRVTVKRNLGQKPAKTFSAGGGEHAKINVATVRVFALTNITPAMLPGLRSDNPFSVQASDHGNAGLWQLMHDRISPEFASSVSGFSSRFSPGGRRYRPTLEPFLTFYLTRSIPNALALRLEQGRLRAPRHG